MKSTILWSLALLVSCAGTCVSQTGLEARWQGFWIREGDSLRAEFNFTDGPSGYSGTFESGQFRAIGVPVTGIRLDHQRVHFEIAGDVTTTQFDGEIRGDSLRGNFLDGKNKGTFVFHRLLTPPPRLLEEDVVFKNGDANLSGTIILPSLSGRAPAVVFVHGSGPEGRWASRYLAIQLARHGIASLIFDKRGAGTSTGDWQSARLEDLAGDVCAGVALLKSHPNIDPLRIGLHGHSQGGALVPLVASLCDVAFVIGSSAPGIPMDELEIYSVENSIGVPALSSRDSLEADAYVRELISVAYHGGGRARLDSLTETARNRSWFFSPPPRGHSYWTLSRNIGAYDPIAYWNRVRVPVLLLYGERDERVPALTSERNIVAALHASGNTHVTSHVFPDADHMFRLARNGKQSAWPRDAQGYPDILIQWIREQSVR